MEKTLGGERLHSGNKMKVQLDTYNRSTHNLSSTVKTTQSCGTVAPLKFLRTLPGDTWDFELSTKIFTMPTIGPAFIIFESNLDVFWAADRLYNARLMFDETGLGQDMENVHLPQLELSATTEMDINDIPNPDTYQIGSSCILRYCGISGIGTPNDTLEPEEQTRQFNIVPLLMYWDTVRNYMTNKQEKIAAVIHTPIVAPVQNVTIFEVGGTAIENFSSPPYSTATLGQDQSIEVTTTAMQPLNQLTLMTNFGPIQGDQLGIVVNQTATTILITYDQQKWGNRTAIYWYYTDTRTLPLGPIQITTFDLKNLDRMRRSIMRHANDTTPWMLNDFNEAPFTFLYDEAEGAPKTLQQSQEGLALRCYKSDLLNNWLNTEDINAINEMTAISTVGNSFTIDAFRFANKLNQLMQRVTVAGSTYSDWVDTVYTVERMKQSTTPIYYGGLIRSIVFDEVVSNAEAAGTNSGGQQPLGTLAGRGVMGEKHEGGNVTIKTEETGYIMITHSVTPIIDYAQGNSWDVNLKTVDDSYKPQMGQIGFEDLSQELMAAWSTHQADTGEWIQKSAGKQPAWVKYMTDTNRNFGGFMDDQEISWMVANRRYRPVIEDGIFVIDDVTTYIDPQKFNYIFADAALDSQNFWVQVGIKCTARRLMSAKVMPSL